jgi:hypothetical protein
MLSHLAHPTGYLQSCTSDLNSRMNLTKREFFQVLGAGTMAGMGLGKYADAAAATASNGLYDIPKFGNWSFLHMTECRAQLKPIYFREPSINIGLGSMKGNLPIWRGSIFSRWPRCVPVRQRPTR